MKSQITLFVLSALVTLVTACGNNTSSIQSNSDQPGAGAQGANVDIKSCQVNQAYTTQYGCLSRNQCNYGAGYSVQTGSCVQGQLVTEQIKFGSDAGTRHYGQLVVTNPQQFELLLQQSQLCNSAYGSSYGASYVAMASTTRCSTWITRGSFIVVKSFNNNLDNVNLTLGAGTQFPTDLVSIMPGVYAGQYGQIGAFGAIGSLGNTNYISINQQAHNYSYNNNIGMQIVAMTPDHKPMNLMLLVNNGNLGLDKVDAQLVFQGTEVATVSLQRF